MKTTELREEYGALTTGYTPILTNYARWLEDYIIRLQVRDAVLAEKRHTAVRAELIEEIKTLQDQLKNFHHPQISEEGKPTTPEALEEWPDTTPAELLLHICEITGITIEDMKVLCRIKDRVRARAIYYYLGKTLYGFGPLTLGQHSNRDHSNVIHHIRKYSEAVDNTKPWYDKELDIEIERVKAKLYERLTNSL